MTKLDECIALMTDRELDECFVEINEFLYGNSGILKIDGVVRNTIKEYENENNTEISHASVLHLFLFEIAKRWYIEGYWRNSY